MEASCRRTRCLFCGYFERVGKALVREHIGLNTTIVLEPVFYESAFLEPVFYESVCGLGEKMRKNGAGCCGNEKKVVPLHAFCAE